MDAEGSGGHHTSALKQTPPILKDNVQMGEWVTLWMRLLPNTEWP